MRKKPIIFLGITTIFSVIFLGVILINYLDICEDNNKVSKSYKQYDKDINEAFSLNENLKEENNNLKIDNDEKLKEYNIWIEKTQEIENMLK